MEEDDIEEAEIVNIDGTEPQKSQSLVISAGDPLFDRLMKDAKDFGINEAMIINKKIGETRIERAIVPHSCKMPTVPLDKGSHVVCECGTKWIVNGCEGKSFSQGVDDYGQVKPTVEGLSITYRRAGTLGIRAKNFRRVQVK